VSELENSVGEDLPFEEGEDQGGGIEKRYCQELCSEECGSGGVSELENSVGEDLPFKEGEDQGGGVEFAPVLGR